MRSNVRRRLPTPSPATAMAFVAMVFAMGGFAVAAIPGPDGKITGCYQKKKGSLRVIDARRKCKRDERRLSWSQRGPAGDAGPAGSVGPAGSQGPPGPFSEALPSGQTLRGAYDVSGMNVMGASQNIQAAAVSFAFALPSPPTPHFVGKGTAPPAECPGNATSPAANPGHLCVFEGGQFSNNSPTIVDPATQGTAGTSRFGFVLYLTPFTDGTFSFDSHGTWAVAAP